MRQQFKGKGPQSKGQLQLLWNQPCKNSNMHRNQNVTKSFQVKKMRAHRIEEASLFSEISKIIQHYQTNDQKPHSPTDPPPVLFDGLNGRKTYQMGAINSIAIRKYGGNTDNNLIYNLLENPNRENNSQSESSSSRGNQSRSDSKRIYDMGQGVVIRNETYQCGDGEVEGGAKRTCQCKKTKCMKNNCLCHRNGNKCTFNCYCMGCRNL